MRKNFKGGYRCGKTSVNSDKSLEKIYFNGK